MKIPFIDLERQQQRIYATLMERIQKVLAHGQYIMGPEIRELEERLGDYAGVRHAVACSSGTDALLMALMAYGVGPGDAIFTTPFTFVATAEVIALLGATPVFVDIDPVTFNLDPRQLERAIHALRDGDSSAYPLPEGARRLTPRGVIAVDLFGQTADYGAIMALAKAEGLFVIEDAAQSFGALHHGKRACALADMAATSFFPAKPLGCYGDAGMIFTASDELADRLNSIRVHGKGSDKYDNIRIGLNGRCDTLQAAILLAKFEIFPEEVELRDEVARRYTERFSRAQGFTAPQVLPGLRSVWAQYSVLSQERGAAMQRLKEAGVPTAVYYPLPLHLQQGYAYLGYHQGDFPVSEQVALKIFSLPMHPYLSEEEQDYIVTAAGK